MKIYDAIDDLQDICKEKGRAYVIVINPHFRRIAYSDSMTLTELAEIEYNRLKDGD